MIQCCVIATKTCRAVATHGLSGPVLFMLTRKAVLYKIKTTLKLDGAFFNVHYIVKNNQ